MTIELPGFPADQVSADVAGATVHVNLDSSLYPLDAVYGAAYVFIDKCYVFLDQPEPEKLRVSLTDKTGDANEETLTGRIGEFVNELLTCAWRHRIAVKNRSVIEATTMQAIAGASGPASLEDLEEFDFSDDGFEDPLGIAMSWEDKYSKEGRKAKKDEQAEQGAETELKKESA